MNIQTIVTDFGAVVGALLILDNAVDAILELFGLTKWETRLTLIARWLNKIIAILPKGPTAAIIVLFFALQCPVHAQTTDGSTSNTPVISITQAVQDVNVPGIVASLVPKAVNTGFFYNWKDSKVQMTYTYAPVAYNFSWGTAELNIGYASPDVLVGGPGLVLNVPVIEKKWGITAPASIQNILNTMSLVLEPMVGLEQVGGRNRFTGGPGASVKVTW